MLYKLHKNKKLRHLNCHKTRGNICKGILLYQTKILKFITNILAIKFDKQYQLLNGNAQFSSLTPFTCN